MEQVDDNQRDDGRSAPKRCETLGSEPGPSLDHIAQLAAHIFETPMAAIVCREDGAIKCRSAIGLNDTQPLVNSSLLSQGIESGEMLTIEDASADPRFRDDPLVMSSPHLRFWASVPLLARNGQPIGALGIADTKPRSGLSDKDLATLRAIAGLLVDGEQAPSRRDTGSAVLVAMSHDLRTPMNGVLGMAELLLATDGLDERDRRRVDIIKRSGTTLLSLIDHILDVAKLDTEETKCGAEPVDLRALLRQATLDDFGKALQLDILDNMDDRHLFLGDTARVQKLVTCFLSSAARSATEGTIRLIASADIASTGRARIQLKVESTTIDYEAIERLLASLSTPADPDAGYLDEAGLELTLCRKLAMTMGGAIGIDRTSSSAPAFWLDLSLLASSQASTTSPAPEDLVIPDPGERQSAVASPARHVLVAEDNPDMAMLIEDLLDEAGYRATIAYDGASTLKVLDEQHFDIVLMDGRMPDMSGFETTAFIRGLPDERADIPIIALTGEALIGDRERYLSAGMNDYIAKPVDYETLIDTIERCCSQRQIEKSSDMAITQNA